MNEIEARILIVDDETQNCDLIARILSRKGYVCRQAFNGMEALDAVESFKPDLIILDIIMPQMDGFEVCRTLKSKDVTKNIPVILVTGLDEPTSRVTGLQAGANDFLGKPLNNAELILRTKNLLSVKKYNDLMQEKSQLLEAEVNRRTSELQNALDTVHQSQEELTQSHLETIHRLTIVAEYKDMGTANHINRIGHYCKFLAEIINDSSIDPDMIYHASPLHDIGKIGIPVEILLKPSKLNGTEFELMKTHPRIGADILQDSKSRYLQMGREIALTHHERWDGSGYPAGLRKDDIPLTGRLMILADQYDALRSTRPYKLPFNHERAVEIICNGDRRTMPQHFDPDILEIFKKHHKTFRDIYSMSTVQEPASDGI